MPPTFLLFLFALHWACDGSFEKKLTIGFTLSTAPFAISCISDSFIRFERDAFVDIALMVGVKLFFW
ncbi:MAG: hypothetical protein PUD20_09910, partial [bacterium]|nr:hypothetical protein [bacterium]